MQADPKADVLEPAGAAKLSFCMSDVCLENSSNLERLHFSLFFSHVGEFNISEGL